MPGRQFTAVSSYRYGFNGKEKDKDIGSDNYDFSARIYDGRIGKWLSIDPVPKTYESSYMSFANNPIWILDPNGADTIKIISTTVFRDVGTGISKKITNSTVVISAPGDDVIYHQTIIRKFDINGKDDWGGPLVGKSEFHVHGTIITSPYDKKKTPLEEWSSKPEESNWYKLGQIISRDAPDLYHHLMCKDPETYSSLAFAQGLARMNRVAANIANLMVIFIPGPKISVAGKAEEFITLYRSISEAEYKSIIQTNKLSFPTGGMEVKQFWQTKEGLEGWNKTFLAGQYNLEITVPKSLLGNGKALNTATQVDEFIGPSATIDNSKQLNNVNNNIKEMKITHRKKN